MKYNKLIVAVVFTVVQLIIAAFTGDSHIDAVEWIAIAIGAVNALIVVIVPNLPEGSGIATYAKSWTAAVLAGLVIAANLILDGNISGTDWTQIAAAVLAALGIFAVPNVTAGVRAVRAYDGTTSG